MASTRCWAQSPQATPAHQHASYSGTRDSNNVPGYKPLAGTLPLFKLCGPHSLRRGPQTALPLWEREQNLITVSSKLMFPHSDIIFHPNRKYGGATLLVLLGSNACSGPVSGPQHPSPPLKILCPEHSATVCVPASQQPGRLSGPHLGTQDALNRVVRVLGAGICPPLVPKDQVPESSAQALGSPCSERGQAWPEGCSSPGSPLPAIPAALLGMGARPSLL